MKLLTSFFLASFAAEEESRGACMSLAREATSSTLIAGGEWQCQREGIDVVKCIAKCSNSDEVVFIDGNRKQAFFNAKGCSTDGARINSAGIGAKLECGADPESRCKKMLADALKAAPIENGSWDCGDFPTRALSCKARCPSGLSLPNNSQRKISLKGCRSISPTIEFLGFNGEPLDCMRPKDRCDNAIRALNVGSNGSWSGLSGDRKRRDTNYHYGPDRNQRFHWEYRLTCNDGRRIAKYRCDKGGNISQQAGYLISMCEYPCHVGDVDELFPLGAGHWNCYSTGNGAKRRCKADCDWNGARKVSFDLECGRFGWQKDPDRNQGKKLDYCQAAPVNDE